MKYDCHFNVMPVDHVTSKATYSSDYNGILENLSIFFRLVRHHVYLAWKLWYKE